MKKVVTKLNEKVLKDVASNLDWNYFRFDNLSKLNKLQNFISDNIKKSMFQKEIKKQKGLD